VELTDAQRDALSVLADGMASRSTTTATDRARGVHGVNSKVADTLIGYGYAHDVPQWRAVEITAAGRRALDGT
jgi:hypothetical protein